MTEPKVQDVMTKEVLALAPDTSLETAARLFSQRGISGAPVVATDGAIAGVVTWVDLSDPDRDSGDEEGYGVYYRVGEGWATELGDHISPAKGRVEEVMTRSVLTVDDSMTITEAARRMLMLGVHRLLVTHGDDHSLVGVVSSVDLLRGFVHPELGKA